MTITECISKILKMSVEEVLKTEKIIDENITSYCQPFKGGMYLLIDKKGNYLCTASCLNPEKALEVFKKGEKNKNIFEP